MLRIFIADAFILTARAGQQAARHCQSDFAFAAAGRRLFWRAESDDATAGSFLQAREREKRPRARRRMFACCVAIGLDANNIYFIDHYISTTPHNFKSAICYARPEFSTISADAHAISPIPASPAPRTPRKNADAPVGLAARSDRGRHACFASSARALRQVTSTYLRRVVTAGVKLHLMGFTRHDSARRFRRVDHRDDRSY